MNVSQLRYLEMLNTALGESIIEFLEDDDVIEVMVNPDGKLHVDTLTQGKYYSLIEIPVEKVFNIIKIVAACHNQIVNEKSPQISTTIPFNGARFQGWLPPIVNKPIFNIRKRALRIFTLEDYVADDIITKDQKAILQAAIIEKKNIIIAGSTSSGKTTLANALLHELSYTGDRVIVLEDTPELQLSCEDMVTMRTSSEISMQALVKGALRMRPDRIIVGEVRDRTAFDLLKAWNTGHPGSFCTLHANSAKDSITRLEDLIREVIPIVPSHLIVNAVDIIIFIARNTQGKRYIESIVKVKEL